MSTLQSLIADRWVGSARRRRAGQRHRRRDDPPRPRRRDRFRRGARARAPHRRRGAARARLPAARGAAEGARRVPQREEGRALRDLAPHRRDAQRRLGRHRGRHRHALRLRVDGRQRAALGQRAARRAAGRARQEGQLRRHPHPGAARRRRRPHQRLQLSGLGAAREVRADLPRRHAVHRQAGDRDQLPHRGAGADDDRLGAAAGGEPAARHRLDRRPARPAREQRRRHLHRLGRHGAEAARQRATCWRARSRSTPRPIRSTPRSSAPTWLPTTRSSTCSSRRSRAR